MAQDFRVTLDTTSRRAAAFQRVFGRLEVCVQSPIPLLAILPGFDAPQAVFLLDLSLITPDERGRLVEWLAERFGLPAEEINSRLEMEGLPILASECSLIIDHPQRWID